MALRSCVVVAILTIAGAVSFRPSKMPVAVFVLHGNMHIDDAIGSNAGDFVGSGIGALPHCDQNRYGYADNERARDHLTAALIKCVQLPADLDDEPQCAKYRKNHGGKF